MIFGGLILALSLHGAASQPRPTAILAQSGDGPSSCELHLWPAERLNGLGFSLYNGLIKGRASNKQIEGAMDDLVSPSAQVAALREADLVGNLGLPPGTRLVEHQESLDRKTLNKIRTRRASSSSPCYSELIVMQHMLIEDIVWGDRFLSTFMFRNFGDKPDAKHSVKGTGGNKLKVLTLAENARPADAPQLVAAALRANFMEYAKNAHLQAAAKIPVAGQ